MNLFALYGEKKMFIWLSANIRLNLWQKNLSICQSEFISDSVFIWTLKQVQHDKTVICGNLKNLTL